MSSFLFFTMPFLFFLTCSSSHIKTQHQTINEPMPARVRDIALPPGFIRATETEGSFASYLRSLPLKKDKTVYLYNGEKKYNQTAQYAVIDISTGTKNLQQCADAVMRLRAEYLKTKDKPICFADNAGKQYCWANYQNRGWQSYLETVFGMCGTLSLEKQLKPKSWDELAIGDVIIKGGSPGHAVIVVDVAKHKSTGEFIFLLAQSYMPAQDTHILLNENENNITPWYRKPSDTKLYTPEWTFSSNQLRAWP
jgi:Domain of unknown function (4846)